MSNLVAAHDSEVTNLNGELHCSTCSQTVLETNIMGQLLCGTCVDALHKAAVARRNGTMALVLLGAAVIFVLWMVLS
jgi:predicted nucleic acid-binding Zn ribbon protein